MVDSDDGGGGNQGIYHSRLKWPTQERTKTRPGVKKSPSTFGYLSTGKLPVVDFETTSAVAGTMGIGDRPKQCSSLARLLHLGRRTGQREEPLNDHRDPRWPGQGKKSSQSERDNPGNWAVAGRPSRGPQAVSLGPRMRGQPGSRHVSFHRERWAWWCSGHHC